MSQQDTAAKSYMQDAEIFADAFNFYLYDGEQVIRPEQLRELDTTSIVMPYGDDSQSAPVQKYRDILKMAAAKADDHAAYLILGIENQTDIHYAMPVRSGLYDMIQYANQVTEAAKSHRAAHNTGNSAGEFLSGFHKTDRLLPVITLVVYFGASKWDTPKSIHEMLAIQDERLLAYTPDYRINLIAPEEIAEGAFGKFRTELSTVLKYIKYSDDMGKLSAVLHEDTAFHSVSRKTAEFINTVANGSMAIQTGKERVNMCKAIEDMIAVSTAEGEAIGEARGEARGKAEGRAEGRTETLREIFEKMLANGIDEKKAKEILGLA